MPFADDFLSVIKKNKNVKDGFVLVVLEFTVLNEQLQNIINASEQLIDLINKDVAR